MTLQQLAETQKKKLLIEKSKLEKQLAGAPEGTLVFGRNVVRNKTYYKWYVTYPAGGHRKNKIYIPSRNREFARELARKKLRLQRLHDVETELKALDAYLKIHCGQSDLETLLDSPVLGVLLSEDRPKPARRLSEELEKWAHEEYDMNPSHPEEKKVPTVDGIMVRSKSEAFIVLLLSTLHIPYRYECRLDIGGYTIYPDFTIRHPVTGEIFYWEHVGRLDDPGYSVKVPGRLRLYINNGIYPDHNLILTFESGNHPFDISIAQDKVKEFFAADEFAFY